VVLQGLSCEYQNLFYCWLQVRGQVADLLGCLEQEVFLFGCTTLALNAVAEGLMASGFIEQGSSQSKVVHAPRLAWRSLRVPITSHVTFPSAGYDFQVIGW
jgi:hypothetical protein